MSRARNIYKKVKVKTKDTCLLYPTPVVKEQKHLIEVDESLSDFFIFALEENFLQSVDSAPEYLAQKSVHSDKQTVIYEFIYVKLHFNLLKNKESERQKALTIEELLSKKIVSALKKETLAIESLFKVYEKQKICSTCKTLGIEDLLIAKLLNKIPTA